MGKSLDQKRSRSNKERWDEDIEFQKFEHPVYYEMRLVGDVFSYCCEWICANRLKTKFGNKAFSFGCKAWNPEDEAFTGKKCIIHNKYTRYFKKSSNADDPNTAAIRTDTRFMMNAFVRVPNKKGKFTEEMDEITQVTPVKFPGGVIDKFMEFASFNNGNNITDPKKGMTVLVRYDKKKDPAKMWDVQKGEKHKLTSEQKEAELIDFDALIEAKGFQDTKEIEESLKRSGYVTDDEDDPEYDSDEKSSKKKKKKPADEDDEDDSDDDEEEDEAPKKKKKKPVDDDDDEEDSEDDDDDEPPVKKKKKKEEDDESEDDDSDDEDSDEDDDDDEDAEDSDEDDEEEESPKKKKKKPVDDDDDDDDDEEEDEKPKKGKKSVSKKKKPVDDDDDEDDDSDDDEDEDDEEEDEKPKKGKKSSGSKIKAPDNCPAKFGKFAGKSVCNKCSVKLKCLHETEADDE